MDFSKTQFLFEDDGTARKFRRKTKTIVVIAGKPVRVATEDDHRRWRSICSEPDERDGSWYLATAWTLEEIR